MPTAQSGLAIRLRSVRTPVGAVVPYAGDLSDDQAASAIVAEGWLPCDGSPYPIARYPMLYRAIRLVYTPASVSDGGQTFCVPDYRGWFLRGLATDASQDPGFSHRAAPPQGTAQGVGSTQPGMVQTHEHNFAALSGAVPAEAGTGAGVPPTTTVATTGLLDAGGTTSLTGEETRPQNIYVNFLIKAEARIRVLGAL
jgi:microcystin-dependent protein